MSDSEIINKYIKKIKNAEKKKYAYAYLRGDDIDTPNLSYMGRQSVRLQIDSLRSQSNPNILSRLRKGVRGHIKLSRGRLIIKT
jgi:hypothetical protein